MSTEQTFEINSTSFEHTLDIAARIGKRLRGSETIELVSDLGGGKTAFVKGLAQGMGYAGAVRSPSFTLSNEYKAGAKRLVHFDFYRLNDPGVLRDELAEAIEDSSSVVAVEWADIVEDVLPVERLTVKITPTGETSRTLLFTFPDGLLYLVKDVT